MNRAQELRTYLMTAATAQRTRLFEVAANAELFVDVLLENRSKGRFDLYAFVVMPDHVHVVLTPAPEVPLEKVAQSLKGGFSSRLKSRGDVWEEGFDSLRIRNGTQFDTCQRYVEENPVRAKLVAEPGAYPHSSWGRGDLVDAKPFWFETRSERVFVGAWISSGAGLRPLDSAEAGRVPKGPR